MKRILTVTSRNVVTSGGEFSLIHNRAGKLASSWGVQTDLIALCNTRLGVSEGKEAFGHGVYIRRDFMNPFQLMSGYSALISTVEKRLRAVTYDAVLLSGVGLPRYVSRIKRLVPANTLVCADVHGYYGDGKLLARDEPLAPSLFHKLAASVEEYEQKHYLRSFDRVFIVSSAYGDYLVDVAGCGKGQFYVVPCATAAGFSVEKGQQGVCRETYRKKYGITEEEWLLVYSGGVSSWQCLPQTIELFEQIAKRHDARLLILSGDKEGARRIVDGRPGVLVDSYAPKDLPSVFCAADCFMMLREDVPTNHFAYPNKFLEYVAAHRPVVSTPYVYDVAQQIKDTGVGILFTGDVDDLVRHLGCFSCEPETYDALVARNSFDNTLKPFVDDLNK